MHRRPSAILAMLDRETTRMIEERKAEARRPLREKHPVAFAVLTGLAILIACGAVGYFIWRCL